MVKNTMLKIGLGLLSALAMTIAPFTSSVAKGPAQKENKVNTEAGEIDFGFLNYAKYPLAFHQIVRFSPEDKTVELEDGSLWEVSKIDASRGWESSKRLVVTQNHSLLSTIYNRLAIANPDVGAAIPISRLVREPNPHFEKTLFVKHVDRQNNVLNLNNDSRWIVHTSDSSALDNINQHDRIIIGVNTREYDGGNPYILIDTAINTYVRAQPL